MRFYMFFLKAVFTVSVTWLKAHRFINADTMDVAMISSVGRTHGGGRGVLGACLDQWPAWYSRLEYCSAWACKPEVDVTNIRVPAVRLYRCNLSPVGQYVDLYWQAGTRRGCNQSVTRRIDHVTVDGWARAPRDFVTMTSLTCQWRNVLSMTRTRRSSMSMFL